MIALNENAAANLQAARNAVDEIVAQCVACRLVGFDWELLIMYRLATHYPLREMDDAVLIAIAGMALARLAEHERGERSTAA